jgi:NAD-dependent deacetylase sirtuin 1
MPRIEIFRGLLRALGMKPKRKRTRKYNLTETVDLIRNSKKILILTGAGISVSCGIPDFRSRNGLYAKLAVDFPELPDPQSMFSLNFFKSDPRPFFRFAKEIFPGNFSPSPSHNFIAQLEKDNKMKRLYSQNIDGLEQQAGIEKVIQVSWCVFLISWTIFDFSVMVIFIPPIALIAKLNIKYPN